MKPQTSASHLSSSIKIVEARLQGNSLLGKRAIEDFDRGESESRGELLAGEEEGEEESEDFGEEEEGVDSRH